MTSSSSSSKLTRAFRVVALLVVLWVVVSPVLWWSNISHRYDVQLPFQLLVQPIALAVTGIMSLPFLWRESQRAAVALMVVALVIAFSLASLTTAFPQGVLVNATLLWGIGFAVWRVSRKAHRAASNA